MFSRLDNGKKMEFIGMAKAAREERACDKRREQAAVTIQALIRRYLVRCSLNKKIREEVDGLLCIPAEADAEYKPSFRPAAEVFHIVQKFFMVIKDVEDMQRFEYLCRYVLATMNSETLNKNVYVSVILSKDLVVLWINQVKQLLWQSCLYLKILKPENQRELKMITCLLHLLVTFTSTQSWRFLSAKNGESLKPGMNQLCKNLMGHLNTKGFYPILQALLIRGICKTRPCFKPTTLTAIVTVAFRPLIAADLSDNLLTVFLLNILSVPALIHCIRTMSPDCLIQMMTHRVFKKSLVLLSNNQITKIIFNTLEGNYALCLMANLIQLGNSEMEGLVESTGQFMSVVSQLLGYCQQYVQSKRSNLTHWHPVLGWFAQKADSSLNEAMPLVTNQLAELWSMKMINLLFEPLFCYASTVDSCDATGRAQSFSPSAKNFLKKAFDKVSSHQNSAKLKVDNSTVTMTCQACGVYLMALQTLAQLRLDIMAGLCYQDVLLPRLWMLISHLGPQCGLKIFLEVLAGKENDINHPLFDLLQLSCDTALHIITILDDVEMYEQEQPFPLQMLISISGFLNSFIFHSIWDGHIAVQTATSNEVFNSAHSLLIMLYDRDCRRPYAPANHWLIKDIKTSVFLSELSHNKKSARFLLQRVPHIIPHSERVVLFRKTVLKDKEVLGVLESTRVSPQSTLITVHRSRLIEDGYRQLAALLPNALKGIIRVKFVNEQGLDEAGIDQDGVFKEFLEETIKRVFDPSLNLFRATDEQKLYPSPTSYLQDNHLALFDFVGRMLGKAVYEGIVVDVPFASFFLSQLLGHRHSATYSSMDELPSLDPELYKSLTYIKHYKGDVGDLDLTFSYDEDIMGKLVTHELIPGGRAISVTDENKISYLHLMAHFKMRVLIKEQSNAFIHGFKSIISSEWLEMFSAPELQKLISGDTTDIDLEDLRKNTQYYGGFHNSHRVISWLWDILENDFTPHERSLFLKFVTSCSKAPLLGFAHLEPPFSIRCVEVSDDQDTGDTVGSVLKGFFNIRKRDPVGRLPTSSTCFNLLKLPNYQKKSTLREKLRYSITSNTGFELS